MPRQVRNKFWIFSQDPNAHQSIGLTLAITAISIGPPPSTGAVQIRWSSYYVTEDSAPARLGSSLGWLLQLDGTISATLSKATVGESGGFRSVPAMSGKRSNGSQATR